MTKQIKKTKNKTNVPATALVFDTPDVSLQFAKGKEADSEELPKLQMTGYSGGVIKNHWWWGNLAIDLEGIKFSEKKFPILENHDTERKIAFTEEITVDTESGLQNNPEKTVILDNEYATEFVQNAKQGFPYQASIYVQPSVIEEVKEGAEVEVNGFTVKGPGAVFRKCEFKEMSVCVFGWDSSTNATAFSKSDVDLSEAYQLSVESDEPEQNAQPIEPDTEEPQMDIAQLKKDYPDLYKEVFSLGETAGKEAAEQKFTSEKTELEASLETMKSDLAKFAKQEAIRAEKEMRMEADALFSAKLAKSEIPEHLYSKVRPHVAYTKYVNEGVLDKEAFGKAIDSEIQSWIDAGVTSTVMGSSFTKEDPVEKKEQFQQEIDTTVDSLLSFV
jgi:hypothetical protein